MQVIITWALILSPNCVSAWLIKGCVCGEINTALSVHGVMMESRTMAYLTTVRNIWVSKDEAANNDPVLRLTHSNFILLPLQKKTESDLDFLMTYVIYSSMSPHQSINHTINQKGLLNRLHSY